MYALAITRYEITNVRSAHKSSPGLPNSESMFSKNTLKAPKKVRALRVPTPRPIHQITKMSAQIEVNNAVAAALVALKTENKKLRTEHDKMAETLKVSQEAHSQVVGEMKAEIDKLKSDLKKANEKKDVAMARLLESLLKREPSTTNQEK